MLVRCWVQPLLPLDVPRSLRFRALPVFDTDIVRMFTHSYAAFMGLARWHLLFGSEFRAFAWRNKWAPVATSEVINYKKSIRTWQAFELRTRIVYWDEARFYIEHSFTTGDAVCVRALVEGLVRGPDGVLHPGEVFGALGVAAATLHPTQEEIAEIECLKRQSGRTTS